MSHQLLHGAAKEERNIGGGEMIGEGDSGEREKGTQTCSITATLAFVTSIACLLRVCVCGWEERVSE